MKQCLKRSPLLLWTFCSHRFQPLPTTSFTIENKEFHCFIGNPFSHQSLSSCTLKRLVYALTQQLHKALTIGNSDTVNLHNSGTNLLNCATHQGSPSTSWHANN